MKWVVAELPDFSQFSAARIDSLARDFERRLEAAGATKRTALLVRATIESNFERAAELCLEAQRFERDWSSDCHACEIAIVVRCLLRSGDSQGALERAEPILSGRLACHHVPHMVYCCLAVASLRLGQVKEADVFHRRGYMLVKTMKGMGDSIATHLAYVVARGDLVEGLQIFERHIAAAHQDCIPGKRLAFYYAAKYLFDRLVEGNEEPLRVRLPRAFPGRKSRGVYPPSHLRDVFGALSDEHEKAFQASGSSYSRRARWYVDTLAGVQQPLPRAAAGATEA